MQASFRASTLFTVLGILFLILWLPAALPVAAAPAAVVTPGTEVPTSTRTAIPSATASQIPEPSATPTNAPAPTDTPEAKRTRLSVEKRVVSGDLVVGGLLTYSIRVFNTGDAPAHDVLVTDSLPASLAYVSAEAPRGAISVSGNTVTFDLDTLGDNAEITLTIVARILAAGEIGNTVVVSTSSSTDRPEDNTAGANVIVSSGGEALTPTVEPTLTATADPLTAVATTASMPPTPVPAPPAATLPNTGGEEGPAVMLLVMGLIFLMAGALLKSRPA